MEFNELDIEIENLEIQIDAQHNNLRQVDLRIKKIQLDLSEQIKRQEEAKLKVLERIKILEEDLNKKIAEKGGEN